MSGNRSDPTQTAAPAEAMTRSHRAVLSLVLPAEPEELSRARQLAGDRNVRVDNLVACISQDPVLSLELLHAANAEGFRAGRPLVSTTQAALIRLGSAPVLKVLEKIAEHPQLPSEPLRNEFEQLRLFGRRASLSAKIIATAMLRDIADEAQTVGLMCNIGQMLACVHFGNSYLELTHSASRSSLNYRLAHNHNFDPRQIQVAYLRKYGFPEHLLFALDREIAQKNPDRLVLRFVIEAAVELVDAYDSHKFDRYKPAGTLPRQSALRMLQLSDKQHENIYDRVLEYLDLTRTLEEKKSLDRQSEARQSHQVEVALPTLPTESPKAETILGNHTSDNRSLLDDCGSDLSPSGDPQSTKANRTRPQRRERKPSVAFRSISFRGTPSFIEAKSADSSPELGDPGNEKQRLLASVKGLCQTAEDTVQLLGEIMQLLTSTGTFVRTAVMTISSDRREASVELASGTEIEVGRRIELNDPLSPLSACLTKLQSFNSQNISDITAPLGVSCFAVSPLKISGTSPTVLYADLGLDGALTVEHRRVFRAIVGLLNQTLDNLTNSLPKE